MSTLGYWLSFKRTYWVSGWIFKSEVQGQSHVKVGLIKVDVEDWGEVTRGKGFFTVQRKLPANKRATVNMKMSKGRTWNKSRKRANSVSKSGPTPPWKLREGNTYSKGEEVMYLDMLLISPVKGDRRDTRVEQQRSLTALESRFECNDMSWDLSAVCFRKWHRRQWPEIKMCWQWSHNGQERIRAMAREQNQNRALKHLIQ